MRILLLKEKKYSLDWSQALEEMGLNYDFHQPYQYTLKEAALAQVDIKSFRHIVLASMRAVDFFFSSSVNLAGYHGLWHCPGQKTKQALLSHSIEARSIQTHEEGMDKLLSTLADLQGRILYPHSTLASWHFPHSIKERIQAIPLYECTALPLSLDKLKAFSHLLLFAPSQIQLLPEPTKLSHAKIFALGKRTLAALEQSHYKNIYLLAKNQADALYEQLELN